MTSANQTADFKQGLELNLTLTFVFPFLSALVWCKFLWWLWSRRDGRFIFGGLETNKFVDGLSDKRDVKNPWGVSAVGILIVSQWGAGLVLVLMVEMVVFVACVCVCVCAQLVCSCVVFGHTVDSLLEYLTTNLINSRVWVYLIVLTPPASKHPSNIRLYLRLTFSHFFVVVLFMPPCHLIALLCFFSVYFSHIVSSFLYKTVCFLFS